MSFTLDALVTYWPD